MSNSIIQVNNLSKSFIISHEASKESYTTLRDVMAQKTKKIFSYPLSSEKKKIIPLREEFWALRDVNFDIKQGDRLGIIGRNGAGKSTLLKIISRITEPTTGEIRIKGRVASLLEVGTGFHPELTGRENIYLNGAILGMGRAEIKRKFDEIVDFAEIEKFLDTPVKRYSSGMYVRLAFAVAAHLEPEILVVDEVLAVGDAQFQKKCLGKMQDVSNNEGRTVLFVSHNIAAIQQLCTKGLFLEDGQIKSIGLISNVLDSYTMSSSSSNAMVAFDNKTKRTGNKAFQFNWIKIIDDKDRLRNEFSIGEDLFFVFEIRNTLIQKNAEISLQIKSMDGMPIFHILCRDSSFDPNLSNITELFKVSLMDIRLFPGIYSVVIAITNSTGNEVYDCIIDAINFTILDGGKYTSRSLPRAAGLFFLSPAWEKLN